MAGSTAIDPLVGAAVVTAVGTIVTAVLSYLAVVHGRNTRDAVSRVQGQATENKESLERIEHATNGQLTNRIRQILRDELIRDPAQTAEMKDLLNAILRGVQGLDDDGEVSEDEP